MCYQMRAAALWQLSQLERPGTPLNTCGRSNNEHSNQLRWASSMAPKKKPEPVTGGLSLATPVLKHACGRQDCFRYSDCHCTTTTTNTTATNPTPAARPPTKQLWASPLFGVHALALSKTHTHMPMTMTMTHSNEVSTRCQPCPTDSNGEVVTSKKRIC